MRCIETNIDFPAVYPSNGDLLKGPNGNRAYGNHLRGPNGSYIDVTRPIYGDMLRGPNGSYLDMRGPKGSIADIRGPKGSFGDVSRGPRESLQDIRRPSNITLPRESSVEARHPPPGSIGDISRVDPRAPDSFSDISRGGGPRSSYGDLAKGPNGDVMRGSCELHCDLESPQPSDSMLKYPLSQDDDEDDSGGRDEDFPNPNEEHDRSEAETDLAPPQATRKPKRDPLQRLASQHGLTKKGLSLLMGSMGACGLLLVALLVLVVLWPRQDYGNKAPVCLTPDCLRAAAEVRTRVMLWLT